LQLVFGATAFAQTTPIEWRKKKKVKNRKPQQVNLEKVFYKFAGSHYGQNRPKNQGTLMFEGDHSLWEKFYGR